MDEQSGLVIELPWPPSINKYWRRNGGRYFISPEGTLYRKNVIAKCRDHKGFFNEKQRLIMSIDAYPPDKRRRDLDNILKAIGDSLQHAEVYEDDNQIDGIHISRMPSLEGKVVIRLQSVLNFFMN